MKHTNIKATFEKDNDLNCSVYCEALNLTTCICTKYRCLIEKVNREFKRCELCLINEHTVTQLSLFNESPVKQTGYYGYD